MDDICLRESGSKQHMGNRLKAKAKKKNKHTNNNNNNKNAEGQIPNKEKEEV